MALMLCSELNAKSSIWKIMPPVPIGQSGHALWSSGDVIYSMGGTFWNGVGKEYIGSIWRLDEGGGIWRRSGVLPSRRAYMASGSIGRNIVLFGGQNGKGEVLDEIQIGKVNAFGDIMWEDQLALPQGVAGADGAFIGCKYYLVSGAIEWGEDVRCTNHVYEIDFGGEIISIRRMHDFPGGARFLHGVISISGKIILFGGAASGNLSGIRNYGDIWEFDPVMNTWKEVGNMPVALRSMAVLKVGDELALLAGGATEDIVRNPRINKTWYYHNSDHQFTSGPDYPLAISQIKLIMSHRNIIGVSGEPPGKIRTPAVFKLRRSDDVQNREG